MLLISHLIILAGLL